MKLHTIIITSALILSASAHGMKEQERRDNAHFKTSGYSFFKSKRTGRDYADDFKQLFPRDQPSEWALSACLCCVLCPVLAVKFVADEYCPKGNTQMTHDNDAQKID